MMLSRVYSAWPRRRLVFGSISRSCASWEGGDHAKRRARADRSSRASPIYSTRGGDRDEILGTVRRVMQNDPKLPDVLDVLKLLFRNRMIREAEENFEDMLKKFDSGADRRRRKSDISSLFGEMLRLYSEIGMESQTSWLLKRLKAMGIPARLEFYVMHLKAALQRRSYGEVRRTYERILEAGYKPPQEAAIAVLKTRLYEGDVLRSHECLRHIRQMKFPPDRAQAKVLNGMIFYLFKLEGNLGKAREYFNKLMNDPEPHECVNRVVFREMMSLLGCASYWGEAVKLFDMMEGKFLIERDASVVRVLVLALSQVGDQERLFEVLKDAARAHLDVQVSNVLLTKLVTESQGDSAKLRIIYELFLTGGRRRRTSDWYFKQTMRYALNLEDVELSMEILEASLRAKSTPAYSQTKHLLVVSGRKGLIDEARRAAEVLQEVFRDKNFHTFYWLINACANADQPALSEQYLKEAVDFGLKQKTILWDRVLHVHARRGDFDRVRELLVEMRHMGAALSAQSFCILALGHAQNGDSEGVEQAIADMRAEGFPNNRVSYNTLLKVYTKKRDIEAITECWNAMRKENIKPNVYTYSTLIAALAYCGRIDQARELLHEVIAAGIKPIAGTFDPVVRVYIEEGRHQEAMEIYQKLRETGVQPDARLYDVLLPKLCESVSPAQLDVFQDTAVELFGAADADGQRG
ncbi:hypothetical protein NDN08_006102 [Rhodosorus marinus]|uniref:Pentacotripeptide-repeat region of PRORP domain-containing protein n=1 Tax=Rhodosorus marinus TaxID=101924 RepID=A0AAV8UNP8_9RHOD|nr:hypothetical protein NDN08_006102 [Rhodosorus marinus]